MTADDCGCVEYCRGAAKAAWARPAGCRMARPAPHTERFTIDDAEMRTYGMMLAFAWNRLDWRHAGFGALQAYLYEGMERELRVHVWHPALVKSGIADSGLCHDHRFNMRSLVLFGEIVNRDCTLFEDEGGEWETWEVLHARAAKEKTGESFHQDPTQTGVRYRRKTTDVRVQAGHGYTFAKGAFHESHVRALTITLIEKLNQEAVNARILAPHGHSVVHAFSAPLPSDGDIVRDVLLQAREALSDTIGWGTAALSPRTTR